MQSFKSKVINWIMRNRHLLRFKLQKETFDMNTSIDDFRALCEKGSVSIETLGEGIAVNQEEIAGIRSEWISPDNAPEDKLIFYVHGGGYVSGSLNDHRRVVSMVARKSGYTCLHYEYRLAPEFPFPAALEDSLAVYRAVLEKLPSSTKILFMGESAGGGLTLALLLAIKERKLPTPIAAVVVSPWTDLTCSGASYITKNKRSVAPSNSWNVFSEHYVGENDPANPLISPLFGDLSGLPPLYINAGEDDELYDDGKQYSLKAKETGVDVTFKSGEGMVHCYPMLAPMFPEAVEALDEIMDFINKHME